MPDTDPPLNASATPPVRLASLDALRGFDMFWITGGDVVAAALVALLAGYSQPMPAGFSMEGHPVAAFLATQFKHAAWEGFHFEDLIFPMFVFIAGASLVFALTKTVATAGRAVAARRIVTRVALLIAVGVIYSGGFADGLNGVRWLGVLQRIGFAYGGAGLLFLWLRPRGLIVACAVLLLGYWALLALVPVPGFGVGDFQEGHNLTNWFDSQYLGGKKYNGDHDPEGILSTLPAIASCLLGAFAGLWLRGTSTPARKVGGLLLGGAILLALGWAWNPWFPVIKKLWTSSFVLVAGGWSAILLGAFYWLIDMRGWTRWAQPWIWVGLNPIAVYLLWGFIDKRKFAARFTGGDLQRWLNSLQPGIGDILTALVVAAVTFLFAWFLHRRRVYLRL